MKLKKSCVSIYTAVVPLSACPEGLQAVVVIPLVAEPGGKFSRTGQIGFPFHYLHPSGPC